MLNKEGFTWQPPVSHCRVNTEMPAAHIYKMSVPYMETGIFASHLPIRSKLTLLHSGQEILY